VHPVQVSVALFFGVGASSSFCVGGFGGAGFTNGRAQCGE
jgi:hypothetical protein